MNKKRNTFFRLLKELFVSFPVMVPLSAACMIFASIVAAMPSLLLQKVTAVIETQMTGGDWNAAWTEIRPYLFGMLALMISGVIATTACEQMRVFFAQGFLCKLRRKVFDKMQSLPLSYFDTRKHGDIMSVFTNDVDTIRELISGLPQLIETGMTVVAVFGIMIWLSGLMTLVVLAGFATMFFISKVIGAGLTRYFTRQQKSVGAAEAYVQEMIDGGKVVKVFGRKNACKEEFARLNAELYQNSYRANAYSNCLFPIVMNIGQALYAAVAVSGGVFMTLGVRNFSLSGLPLGLSIVIPFLSMTKQFTGNLNHLTMQITSIGMAMAGAGRVFDLLDQEPETDDGKVALIRRDGVYLWKHPHGDGTVTFQPLKGKTDLIGVDFAYASKQVLFDVSVHAAAGQKIALVGATGAGKTTVANLLNRFYDIADGKIRLDDINVNKIKKADLRKTIGIVLQDAHLFTGTVMDNIRYGRLDATDEECVAAAKIANADDFITRLPNGYQTALTGNGAALSQGQRQLLTIARAAVADAPVLILDEATSSVDTHTEALIQQGMDKLMKGRTVFVIAHRLSTVRNADTIIVLDHGRIIEQGNHDELIAKKGVYYRLYKGSFELE